MLSFDEFSWGKRMKRYLPKVGIWLLLLVFSVQLIRTYIFTSLLNIIVVLLSIGVLTLIAQKIYSCIHLHNEIKMEAERACKIQCDTKLLKLFISRTLPVEIDDKFKIVKIGNQMASSELMLVLNIESESAVAACNLIKKWLLRDVNFKINFVFTNSLDSKENLVVQTINNSHSFECVFDILKDWNESKFLRYTDFDIPLQYTEDELIKLKAEIGETDDCRCYINGHLVNPPYQLKDLHCLLEEL